MKILFQGDSITDAGRDRENVHDLGHGYPKFAAKLIKENNPDVEFEFVDLGISGNQTKDLVDRLQKDFVDVQPDVVSILIGINDVWHHANERDWIPDEVFEERYRTVLTAIKEKTNAKIMMMEPFLGPVEDKTFFRIDLDPKIQTVRKLAREFAAVYVPLDGLLSSKFINEEHTEYLPDGVHPSNGTNVPTTKGAEYIGKVYAEYVQGIIDSLK